MEQLKQAIYSLDDLVVVRDLISQIPRNELEESDTNGLDILHHAILVNYGEVVFYLLQQQYFTDINRECRGPPYIHLSCILGQTYIVSVLLDARPGDFYIEVYGDDWIDWNTLEATIDSELKDVNNARLKSSLMIARARLVSCHKDEVLLPLDVAAVIGHSNVTRLLLTTPHSQITSGDFLESAIKLKSVRTLSLLLNSEKQDQRSLDEAIKTALRHKQPDCVKMLLKCGANIINSFNGMNPYHVLYMYCSAFMSPTAASRSAGIEECTAVLISLQFDVNIRMPVGSYPLYSAIHALIQEKDQNPSVIPVYHLKAFQYLLEAGSNPNFDEVEYSNAFIDSGHALTFGRDLFTSGLNAFFVSLQASDTWRECMDEYLDECCFMLLQHGAQPNFMDSYGETPLHDLMKLWAMQHALGHVHVDLSKMLAIMLKHGADPNLQSSNGLYPVHYYFKILFNLMGGLIAYERWRKSNTAPKVLRMLRLMRTEDAILAVHEIVRSCIEAKEDGMPDAVIKYICQQTTSIVLQPKSLQKMCQFQIWEGCNRQSGFLNLLPLPKKFIAELQNLFDMEDEELF